MINHRSRGFHHAMLRRWHLCKDARLLCMMWQRDGEDRAAFRLTGDADCAAMGLHDGAADSETHAGSKRAERLLASAIEPLEYEGLLGWIDSGSPVGDRDQNASTLLFG